MFRFLLRFMAVICLAVAVMFAVVDATRSLGVSKLVLTPLEVSWRQFFPDTLDPFSSWFAQAVHPYLNDQALATFLTLPTFAVFAILSALFYAAGYRKKRHLTAFERK